MKTAPLPLERQEPEVAIRRIGEQGVLVDIRDAGREAVEAAVRDHGADEERGGRVQPADGVSHVGAAPWCKVQHSAADAPCRIEGERAIRDGRRGGSEDAQTAAVAVGRIAREQAARDRRRPGPR